MKDKDMAGDFEFPPILVHVLHSCYHMLDDPELDDIHLGKFSVLVKI